MCPIFLLALALSYTISGLDRRSSDAGGQYFYVSGFFGQAGVGGITP
jgi:hypothetical protein